MEPRLDGKVPRTGFMDGQENGIALRPSPLDLPQQHFKGSAKGGSIGFLRPNRPIASGDIRVLPQRIEAVRFLGAVCVVGVLS